MGTNMWTKYVYVYNIYILKLATLLKPSQNTVQFWGHYRMARYKVFYLKTNIIEISVFVCFSLLFSLVWSEWVQLHNADVLEPNTQFNEDMRIDGLLTYVTNW